MADSFVIGTLYAVPITAETPPGTTVYTLDGTAAKLERFDGVNAVLSTGARGNATEFIGKYERCCIDPMCIPYFAKFVRVRELLDPKDTEDEGELLRCDSCTEPLIEVWAEKSETDGESEKPDAEPENEAVGAADSAGELSIGGVAPVEVEG